MSEAGEDNLGLAVADDGLRLGRTPLIERRDERFAVRDRGEIERLLESEDDIFRIAGQKRQPDRNWKDDPEQTITFPPGSTTDQVIDRMIEILQDAARDEKRSGM